ncbi:MAG: hypothetical protein LBU32_09720 [Clostridiales bacterium]|jgi:hypothetical protein|nr:hypothetical protein [Clostridiales bacterium]
MKHYLPPAARLDEKKMAGVLDKAKKKGTLEKVAQESIKLIIDNPNAPILESVVLGQLIKLISAEELFAMFISMEDENFSSYNDYSRIDGWVNAALAFSRFPSVHKKAVSAGNAMLANMAVKLFMEMTEVNAENWRRNQERSREIRKCAEMIQKTDVIEAGLFYLPASLSERLERFIDSYYDFSVRDDMAFFARIFTSRDALEACVENWSDYEISRTGKESLNYISLTEASMMPVSEDLAGLLEKDGRIAIKCAVLKRLQGNMRDSYVDPVYGLLSDREPIIAVSALTLLCECWEAYRISSVASELLGMRSEPFVVLYVLRLLFLLRNTWISSSVENDIAAFLEQKSLHENSVWVMRSAAARLLGICGKREELLELLYSDRNYDVRAAAFSGLGGIETKNIKKPKHLATDINALEALKMEWNIDG